MVLHEIAGDTPQGEPELTNELQGASHDRRSAGVAVGRLAVPSAADSSMTGEKSG